MTTSQSTIDFVLDQLSSLPDVHAVKITPAGKALVGSRYEEGEAYPGAKPSMVIGAEEIDGCPLLVANLLGSNNRLGLTACARAGVPSCCMAACWTWPSTGESRRAAASAVRTSPPPCCPPLLWTLPVRSTRALQFGLRALIWSGFKVRTTDSNHDYGYAPKRLPGMSIDGPNQVWVADITYIRILTGFVYLAAILDLFSRKVIGWAISRRIDGELCLAALKQAIETPVFPGVATTP